jgi:hypothetical protein
MGFEEWLAEADKEVAELQERNKKILEAKKKENALRIAEYEKRMQEDKENGK